MYFRLSSFALIASLALSGCSVVGGGAPKYDAVELIEYENCLTSESQQWNLALTEGKIQSELRPGGKFWIDSENRPYQVEEFALSMCEKSRPKPIS
ncbi:hypothetical protein B1s21122_01990 [Candidatus Nanopelagicus limnes]|jgi:hypothetical protein|uniref:Uncharacterized protein n=1 Tax=Candidatus Nanopelagicus limnae TaxID=1884634 RepID=A0A249JX75_9ACTN|nr:hypothetical protein [Candidatus Nanopelagicus limnes]ASY09124.1 hypothetical protein B1s21122_01990 [Candidatus Nanopelagicus limnes]